MCEAYHMFKHNRVRPDKLVTGHQEPMVICKVHLCPGDHFSINQYISIFPVRILHTKGKYPTNKKYAGGTIFVGHASSYVHTTALHDNFPGFSCWGDLIFSKFQNQFCACWAQLGKEYELGLLFNIKISVLLQVGY